MPGTKRRGKMSAANRIDREGRWIRQVKGNWIEPVRDEITMSLPVGTGASTEGRTRVGNSGLRVAGQGPGQVPRPGRILRRAGPTWTGTSAPASEVMRGPGISAGQRAAIAAPAAPEAEAPVAGLTEVAEAGWAAVVLEAAAAAGPLAEGADAKIKNR